MHRPYPIENLFRYLPPSESPPSSGYRHPPPWQENPTTPAAPMVAPYTLIQGLADAVGVTRRTAHRILGRGALTDREADRAAIALGLHPAVVWPDRY